MTNPATHAARENAQRDLEHLLRTAADNPRTDEQIEHVARSYLDGLASAGWHHVSEHHAPPEPTGPPAPSDSDVAQRSLDAMRAELDQIHARHKTEDEHLETT